MWELSLWRIATSWRFREREKVTRPVHLDISGELKKQNQKQLKFFFKQLTLCSCKTYDFLSFNY